MEDSTITHWCILPLVDTEAVSILGLFHMMPDAFKAAMV